MLVPRASEDSNPNTNDLALSHVRALTEMNAMRVGSPETMVSNNLSTYVQRLIDLDSATEPENGP